MNARPKWPQAFGVVTSDNIVRLGTMYQKLLPIVVTMVAISLMIRVMQSIGVFFELVISQKSPDRSAFV